MKFIFISHREKENVGELSAIERPQTASWMWHTQQISLYFLSLRKSSLKYFVYRERQRGENNIVAMEILELIKKQMYVNIYENDNRRVKNKLQFPGKNFIIHESTHSFSFLLHKWNDYNHNTAEHLVELEFRDFYLHVWIFHDEKGQQWWRWDSFAVLQMNITS